MVLHIKPVDLDPFERRKTSYSAGGPCVNCPISLQDVRLKDQV